MLLKQGFVFGQDTDNRNCSIKKVVIRVHLPDVYYSLSGQIKKLIKTLFVLTRLVRTGIKVDKMTPVKRILKQMSIIHLDLVLITYCF